MGYRNQVLVSDAPIPKVRDKGEDLGRDSVDWCDCVSPRSNQMKDLESVLVENTELEITRVSRDPLARFVCLTSALSGVTMIL